MAVSDDPPTPRDLVEQLLDDEMRLKARFAIDYAGEELVEPLLAALVDERFRARPSSDDVAKQVLDHPLSIVIAKLATLHPPEALPPAVPLVDHENRGVQCGAARLIGAIATREALEPLVRIMDRGHDAQQLAAIAGLYTAARDGRVDPTLGEWAFDVIAARTHRRCDTAPCIDCLLALDRDRAAAMLTTPNNFDIERLGFARTAHALWNARVVVNEPMLLDAAQRLMERSADHRHNLKLVEVLRLLSLYQADPARLVIESNLRHAHEHVQNVAAESLAMSYGIDSPINAPLRIADTIGWEGMSNPQRTALVVRHWIHVIPYLGLFQYFEDADLFGDDELSTELGVAAFETIGDPHDAQIIRDAIATFGPNGPSRDTDTRLAQLEQLYAADEYVFEDLESAFTDNDDVRERLFYLHVIEHRDEFIGR